MRACSLIYWTSITCLCCLYFFFSVFSFREKPNMEKAAIVNNYSTECFFYCLFVCCFPCIFFSFVLDFTSLLAYGLIYESSVVVAIFAIGERNRDSFSYVKISAFWSTKYVDGVNNISKEILNMNLNIFNLKSMHCIRGAYYTHTHTHMQKGLRLEQS